MRVRNSQERGALTLLCAVIVVPILFFAAVFSIDLAGYARQEERLQHIIDEAALNSTKFLPRVELARKFAQRVISEKTNSASSVQITADSDRVSIRAQGSFPMFFGNLIGAKDLSLPIVRTVVAGMTPIDGIVVLDSTNYVAPDLSAGEPWGDEVSWPAAPHAQKLAVGLPNPEIAARRITQQCFNPVFSRLKSAAIDLFDYIGAFNSNSIGAAVYTGDVVRPLEFIRSISQLPTLPATAPESREATFIEAEREILGTPDCAIIAQEGAFDPTYRLESRDAFLPSRGDFTVDSFGLIDPLTRQIDESYLDLLQTREVFWSQVARVDSAGSFELMLELMVESLLAAPYRESRGNLVTRPVRVGFIIAAQLPKSRSKLFPEPDTIDAIQLLITERIAPLIKQATEGDSGKNGVKIIYILQRTPNFTGAAEALSQLEQTVNAAAVEAGLTADQFLMNGLYTEDPEQLRAAVLPYVTLKNRASILMR